MYLLQPITDTRVYFKDYGKYPLENLTLNINSFFSVIVHIVETGKI